MTRAPKDTDPALRRMVTIDGQDMIAEIHERRVVLRYPRQRKPVLETTWGVILNRILMGG